MICIVRTAHTHMICGGQIKPKGQVGMLNTSLLGKVGFLSIYVFWTLLISKHSSFVLDIYYQN